MTLQQLIYFQTIAREKNFTRSAELLCITQPNLSHAIRQLESELGVQLFARQGRTVELTHYGNIYLNYVRTALTELDNGKKYLDEVTEKENGSVLLAYVSSLSEYIPFLASRYLLANPLLHTRFQMFQRTHGDVCQDVSGLVCNLGFSTHPDSDSLETYRLGSHPSVVIVSDSHPWAGRSHVSLRELDGQNFVAYSLECRIRHMIDEMLLRYDVHPVIVSELMYDNLVFGMVNADFGIAIVPEPMGMHLHHIHVLQIEEPNTMRDIYMIWSRNNYLPPAAAAFRDFIIERNLTLEHFQETILT